MIYPLFGLVAGAILGALRAKSRGGKMLDLLQWATVLGLIGAILGLFVLVTIERSFV